MFPVASTLPGTPADPSNPITPERGAQALPHAAAPRVAVQAPTGSGPAPARVKFGAVMLVCAQCEERKSGPTKLRSKDARKALKAQLGGARHRVRIMEVSCMGLCPKKAIAIAAIGPGAPMQAVEARKASEVAAFAKSFAEALS
ncbi:MAG: hypothetical protein EOO24_08965 [Comamonadaceae bacterium]|nr:MAG: hypothetical protein EOO24_08965 [Comamonadaceae bacterium]